MIAITALLATVLPNVGPTEVLLKSLPLFAIPNSAARLADLATLPAGSCLAEIWKPLLPSALSLTFWTVGVGAPAALITELTCAWVPA